MTAEALLSALALAADTERTARADVAHLAAACREHDIAWADIAEAADMSRQRIQHRINAAG